MIIARRLHLYPSRTQKLSSVALMILGGRLPGKVGHRRFYGPMVKRLRHRPFTAVTRVRFPVGSPFLIYARLVELADTPDLGSGGRPWGFKSLDAHQNNTVHRSARWILFYLPNMRSWRNWQTRTVQVRVRRLMGVRIPLTAPDKLRFQRKRDSIGVSFAILPLWNAAIAGMASGMVSIS